MNILACALTLVLACSSPKAAALNAATAAAAFTQAYAAQRPLDAWNSGLINGRLMWFCPGANSACPPPLQRSIVAPPWQKADGGFAYVSTGAQVFLTNLAGEAMRRSGRPWVRKISWLPQALTIAGNAAMAGHNFTHRRVPAPPVITVRF